MTAGIVGCDAGVTQNLPTPSKSVIIASALLLIPNNLFCLRSVPDNPAYKLIECSAKQDLRLAIWGMHLKNQARQFQGYVDILLIIELLQA